MITIKTFSFNALQENTYVLYDETKECVIIDPGCYNKEERDELKSYITNTKLQPVRLLNTHCHIDHVLGNAFVSNTYSLKVETSRVEEMQLRGVKLYAPMYGFNLYEESEVGNYIEEGDLIAFGNSKLEILSLPGHSPGHLAFLSKDQNFCIGGDVLFRGSIGRADLPGGDFKQLEKSIKTKLYILPDATIIYPGHGPITDIGFEKRHNPYVKA